MGVKHAKQSGLPASDGSTSHVRPIDWYADHTGTPGGEYNVKDPAYGAVGDGVTDDSTAINAAITAANAAGGGNVIVPTGTYIVNAISVKSNVTLKGMGWSSILKHKAGSNSFAVYLATSAANAGIMDLKIDGNKANQSDGTSCYGFGGDGGTPDNCFAINCWITNTVRSGIYYVGTRFRAINNVVDHIGLSVGTGRTGIVVSGETNPGGWSHIIGNYIEDCTEYNIKLYGYYATSDGTGQFKTIIANNVCRDSDEQAIYISNNKNIIVANNVIDSPAQYGIHIQSQADYPSEHISIIGNTCRNSTGYSGILLQSFSGASAGIVRDVSIVGNTCEGNYGYGIYVLGTLGTLTGITIGDNVLTGNRGAGLYMNTASHVAINGNVCRNNGTSSSGYGIYGTAVADVACNGNVCTDDLSGYQDYGIYSSSSSSYWVIVGNNCRGNTVDGIYSAGTGNVVSSSNLE